MSKNTKYGGQMHISNIGESRVQLSQKFMRLVSISPKSETNFLWLETMPHSARQKKVGGFAIRQDHEGIGRVDLVGSKSQLSILHESFFSYAFDVEILSWKNAYLSQVYPLL